MFLYIDKCLLLVDNIYYHLYRKDNDRDEKFSPFYREPAGGASRRILYRTLTRESLSE